ncbi:MAG: DUF58 domain-containing protein [Chloroflexi bacterium]|nr:DUF58 domain-containing protein [Chloroflexota bacterium]MBV9600569.1 DUF58 domain-containing protein [Chloroflexota bacterium]
MARKQPIQQDIFRQLDRLSFVSRRPARAGAGGEHVSRRPAPSTDFVDYRAYVPGDDFRRIDWNVYGRLGSLHVKVTEGRERLEVVLVLDCSSSMDYGDPGKLDFATQLVAALAYVGASRADGVRIACLSPVQPDGWRSGPFRRRARVPELVQQLSTLAPAGLVDINAGLAACIPPEVSGNSLVVVVSDLLTPGGSVGGLEAVRARVADVAVLHVVSPEELDPGLSGEVELIDAESGAAIELGVSLETLAAYRRRVAEWLDAREADCRRRGMRYIRVRTDQPVNVVVLDDLRRGGLVR